MDERSADRPAIKTEHRRGSRFPVVVPVDVKWQELSGKTVKEAARANEVNAQGGLLEMKTYPGIGRQLELTNLLSGKQPKRALSLYAVQIRALSWGSLSNFWFPTRLLGE
jgi:muconolactone delta-isomerase